MKITSGLILLLVLLYPFFYVSNYIAFEISYQFTLYYFVPLTLLFFVLNMGKKPVAVLKKNSINLALLGLILLIIGINTDDLRYSKPLLFFIYVINFYLLSLTLVFRENYKVVRYVFLFFSLLSFLFLFKPDRYMLDHRYFSFLLSPTVYSVYAEVVLILFLYQVKSTKKRIFIFLIAGFFIFITKTRLNLFFYISIPFLLYYFENFKASRGKILLVYIFCLNMLYPIYTYLVTFDFGKATLVSTRYENGHDSSFGLRNYLNSLTYDEFLYKTDLSEKLFGKGTEQARKKIIEKIKFDLFTHNDFIRFAYDFGIICTILFLLFLYRITAGHYISFIMLLLYLFSFYHNMIYDFFLISLVIYYSGVERNTKDTVNTNQDLSYA
ncbi:MAG: hypothetical protein V4635_10275 [Bacteroidota bacterium]